MKLVIQKDANGTVAVTFFLLVQQNN